MRVRFHPDQNTFALYLCAGLIFCNCTLDELLKYYDYFGIQQLNSLNENNYVVEFFKQKRKIKIKTFNLQTSLKLQLINTTNRVDTRNYQDLFKIFPKLQEMRKVKCKIDIKAYPKENFSKINISVPPLDTDNLIHETLCIPAVNERIFNSPYLSMLIIHVFLAIKPYHKIRISLEKSNFDYIKHKPLEYLKSLLAECKISELSVPPRSIPIQIQE